MRFAQGDWPIQVDTAAWFKDLVGQCQSYL